MRRTTLKLVTMAVLSASWQPLLADKTASDESSSTKSSSKPSENVRRPAKRKEPPKITPGREAAALTFVRTNHQDLEELLVYLKENNARTYRQVITQLFRTSERLAQIQDRGDTERYELELKKWQADSRVQLLKARFRMDKSKEWLEQLKTTLNEKMDLEVQILKRDHHKLADRVNKLNAEITALTKGREKEVDRQIRSLLRTTKTKTTPRREKATAATAPSSKSTPKTKKKN